MAAWNGTAWLAPGVTELENNIVINEGLLPPAHLGIELATW
jgi:hypothetical protein